ncbi:MAG TPA: arginine--tRNA ligase, partial [Betaproteobacteria bacterium]|nr:arginine--tRNA ligase [Betaproteobacteria bacterium]
MKQHLIQLFREALEIVAPDAGEAAVELSRPRYAQHGDFACNLAMQLAKPLRRSPREIAVQLLAALPPSAAVAKAEVAGAGFINVFLTADAKHSVIKPVLTQQGAYGRSATGKGKKIQVEFVSANPTGPLHVGHGRGAAFGASLANVLDAVGYCVTREFYVNDAGRQMDILAVSVWLRYLELCGEQLRFPENGYRGDYIYNIAREVRKEIGDKYRFKGQEVIDG